MTTARRLATVEAALTPSELVRRWLAEAHAYDDFTAYSRAIYAQGPEALPLDRLVREARALADAGGWRRSREERAAAARTAMGATVFLFHLVLRTSVLAHEALEREALLDAALSANLALALVDGRTEQPSGVPTDAGRLSSLRGIALARVAELRALETARSRVETQYLGGHRVLFPASLRAWTERRTQTEGLADLAVRIAEFEVLAPAPPDDPDAFEARVAGLVANHVDPARVKALDELGEGRRAASIAMRWLEPTLG